MKIIITFIAISALMFACGCGGEKTGEESHEGYNHEEHAEEGKSGHEEHEEESGHEGEENAVTLLDSIASKIGLSLERVKIGRIEKTLTLPGEVVPDGNKVLHVSPRFPGMVKEARKDIGDYVQKGEVLAIIESNENLNPYTVTAQSSGRIIEKHVVAGEFVNEERVMFIIADLSVVWVNIAVYGNHATEISVGQSVRIEALGGRITAKGAVTYISPVYNETTRSLVARVVLQNPSNQWRPGTFIKALFDLKSDEETLLVPNEAVQIVNEKSCVFVKEGEGEYHPVPVQVGVTGRSHTEILSGLSEGLDVVAKGAFELKAQITLKSIGGGHAGHGH
jgi:cobalt-zinc-cadmium efflux system membrane fusion protein